MKVEFKRLTLVGTGRTIGFKPGLNVIYGPISTGKSSVLRLCRIALGQGIESLPEEIRLVPSVGAEVVLSGHTFEIIRALSAARAPPVEIAGDGVSQRLPAVPDSSGRPIYGHWLLEQLGLPRLEVPSAPTRPDSDPTPVSINDYFAYCDLPKEEIRSEVFGHRHPYKDIKRRYVFEILYGQYDVGVAEIQERLRDVRAHLRSAEHSEAAFDRLMADTKWESRAALERELAVVRSESKSAADRLKKLSASAPRDSQTVRLRDLIRQLDEDLANNATVLHREKLDAERFHTLAAQLETQIGRLTRAIVANEKLLDIDFVVCPRCGASVQKARGAEQCCYLCLQPPAGSYGRADMMGELDRLGAQLEETRELVSSRRDRMAKLDRERTQLEAQRARTGAELDETVKSFVSDSAAKIEEAAAERAALREREARLVDYLSLFEKRDRIHVNLDQLRRTEGELLGRLEEAKTRREDVEERIGSLERLFSDLLQKMKLPSFLGKPEGRIHRRTYLPSVNGRTFEELQSEGLSVEVNVAHALAHQLNALKYGLLLPSILLIDGISGAFGEKGYDPARVAAIYDELRDACEQARGALQVIVADTRVPEVAKDSIVLELSERERLVPEEYLRHARLRT